MGTNFYWLDQSSGDHFRDMDPSIHIGRRSAAGAYCWTCGVTLCCGDTQAIHTGKSAWFDSCPQCGAVWEPKREGLDGSAVGVELGFAEARTRKPMGVRSCMSFSWAQTPERVRAICQESPDKILVIDEYGGEYTGQGFLDMLESNCPVEFTHSIGMWFS